MIATIRAIASAGTKNREDLNTSMLDVFRFRLGLNVYVVVGREKWFMEKMSDETIYRNGGKQ